MVSATSCCPRCQAPLTVTPSGLVCASCALQGALAAEEEPELLPNNGVFPRTFGDFEILGEVGRGGMGLVFKARQRSLNRIVALKVLLYGTFSDSKGRKRFRAEAEAAARLQHPNIVAIHEVGEQDGVPYLTMDLVDGFDLSRLCGARPLPVATAARYMSDIAKAVQAAHEAGVLHRDLKPGNIVVGSDGRPRVTDFGLAKRNDDDVSLGLTLSGQMLGSPSYASPEQAGGRWRDVTAASDVYGLGAVLYHLITGRAPFAAATATQTLRMVLEADPVSPRALNPVLPRDLETICLKCLRKDPARRYLSAADLGDDLGRFLDNRPILARPISPFGHAWRWGRRHPATALLSLALFVVLAAAAAVANLEAHRTERAREQANQAQQAAVASRNDAERLANWMLDDLCADIVSSGRREQVAKLAQQTVAYYEKLPPGSRSQETERRRARALSLLGTSLAAQAKFREANAPIQQAVAILERLLAEGDESEATLIALVSARVQVINDQTRSGKVEEAKQSAEATIRLIEPVASRPGASFVLRRAYALALGQVGSCWNRLGNDKQALVYFERTVALQRELARSPEAGSELTIETASSLLALTQALPKTISHRSEIRTQLEESVVAVQQLLKQQPAGLWALETLGRLQSALANYFVGELNAREALRWRQAAVATWERCTLIDPNRADYRFNVFFSRSSAHYIRAAQGEVAATLPAWRMDLEECAQLQGSVFLLSALGVHWRFLAMWLAKNGDRNGAEQALAQQRAVFARSYEKAQPDNETYRHDQLLLSIAAAEVALHLGDLETARDAALNAIAQIVESTDESRRQSHPYLRTAQGLLAWAKYLSGDYSAANDSARTTDAEPISNRYRQRCDYVEWVIPLALALAQLNRYAEAQALLDPAESFLRQALVEKPDHCATLEDVALVLYAQAMAQPPEAGGRRKALLAEAAGLLAVMTGDYRALRSVQRLHGWIAAEQAKPVVVHEAKS